jgi:uncharacterized protein YgbK (DUF1537 family)
MSTCQLQHLIENTNVHCVELSVRDILAPGCAEAEIRRVAGQVNDCLRRFDNVVVHTSRQLARAGEDEDQLHISRCISEGLAETVRRLKNRPKLILAKGGITSSDVATKALGIRRAWVLGQVLPGVPVWRADEQSRFPGIVYIVFPGNVGEPNALTEIVEMIG